MGKDGKIICVQTDKGRKHDFRVFKESNVHIHPEIKTQTDSGYQGIKKYHNNSEVPYKHSKKKKLTTEQKNTIMKYPAAECKWNMLFANKKYLE